jgi:hypothetical protein
MYDCKMQLTICAGCTRGGPQSTGVVRMLRFGRSLALEWVEQHINLLSLESP